VATSPLLKVPPGTRVLDLGCGPGTYAVPLAHQGAEVTGVDLSEAMLDQARQACADAGAPVRLVRADMRDVVEPESFDLANRGPTSSTWWTSTPPMSPPARRRCATSLTLRG
jgi:cyclopropane fatty-acyl-phospholipid synthase-like methyltransferase